MPPQRLLWQIVGIGLLAGVVGTAAAQKEIDDTSDLGDLLAQGSQPVTIGDALLEEGFDEADAWENYQDDGINLRVEEGVYRAQLSDDGYTWGLNEQVHTDVVITANTQQLSEHLNNGYGLMCRADISNNGDGYYFLVSGDGYYSIQAGVGNEWVPLVDWNTSDIVRQGTSENQIVAVCVGDYLALYANDELLAETTDTRYAGGYAGLAVAAFEGGDVDIAFDDLQIWEATSGGKGPDSTTTLSPLTQHAGEPEDAIAELETLGLIPSGGSLVFEEDFAFFSGSGNWFTPLAGRSPHPDVVMAGELTFSVGNLDELEECLLTTRINTNSAGTAITYVDVGITNTGDLLIADVSEEDENATTLELAPLGLNLGEAHHLLILVIDETLTVFVDGQQAIANVPVVERAGTYGISLLGAGPNASCEGRNIWVYQVPSVTPGVCSISAGSAVNRRSGPDTSFDSPGQLPAGQQETAQGQIVGTDGQIWWQLEDGSWVRDDVVNAEGDCTTVPNVEFAP